MNDRENIQMYAEYDVYAYTVCIYIVFVFLQGKEAAE